MRISTIQKLKLPEGVRIPYFGGKLYKFMTAMERNSIIRLHVDDLCLNQEPRKEKIIVSLTTFPARIEVVGFAIKSLFNQTIRPDRIVLWLAENQFASEPLPELLQQLVRCGLEIRYCEDLKAHKKYHYALKEQKKDELVITYDDDLIYPEDSIERLYRCHKEFPECIVCNRAQEACFQDGKLMPYATWRVLSDVGVKEPSSKLFPSTGGGTLYPYGKISPIAFQIDQMKLLAYTADDLWMRFMSALQGTKIVKTRKYHKTFSVLEDSQEESLQEINCIGNENDRALERLSVAYPEALKNIMDLRD